METNSQNLIADINHLERVRDLRHVAYEERLRQLKLSSLERANLSWAFKVFTGQIYFWLFSSLTSIWAERLHLQNSYKGQAVFDEEAVCFL